MNKGSIQEAFNKTAKKKKRRAAMSKGLVTATERLAGDLAPKEVTPDEQEQIDFSRSINKSLQDYQHRRLSKSKYQLLLKMKLHRAKKEPNLSVFLGHINNTISCVEDDLISFKSVPTNSKRQESKVLGIELVEVEDAP